MLKTDPIIGDVIRGTKPVLEPMPEVKPLPDGFRYKPDLANPSSQALHFEQCIDRVRDLSEKQVRGIITTLCKQYVDIQYQCRPGWQSAKSPLKFTGDCNDKAGLDEWVDSWMKPIMRIDNEMKAEIMMGSLTSMVESQLHNLFAVAKAGTQYAINISASNQIVRHKVLAGHIEPAGSRLQDLGRDTRWREKLSAD